MAVDEKLISRINELAKVKKERGLTPEEAEEQKSLREEYLESFRVNVRSNLETIDIVDHLIIDKGQITLDKVNSKLCNLDSIKKIEETPKDIVITYLCKTMTKSKLIDILDLKSIDEN